MSVDIAANKYVVLRPAYAAVNQIADGDGSSGANEYGIKNGRATKFTVAFAAALLIVVFFFASNSWAKGPLDSDVAEFSKNILTPILVREGLCTSRQDCRDKEYFFCISWETISCNVFGITDKKLIKEIFIAMLNSELKIRNFDFWRSTYREKSILEKPLLRYIDRTGDK